MPYLTRRSLGAAAATALLAIPATAAAQQRALGIGPRFSFIRSDVQTDAERERYSGGMLRLRTSSRMALEASLDYRSHLNESLTERIRDYPIQGSLLIFPVNTRLAPYFLGGIGWYSQRVDRMAGETVEASTKTRKVGYHAGVGGEMWIGSRAAIHVDYRYTFIRFGDQDTPTEPGAIPLPGLGGLQKKLKLSHEGSMWTTGVTLYF